MAFDIDVTKRIGDRRIGVALEAGSGLTVLFGPSGAGKTTVLNLVAGLLTPDWGHVRIGGRTLFDSSRRIDLAVERRRAGYVFQDTRLFPHRRVRANLLFGAASTTSDTSALRTTVELLGLETLLDRWPRSLSGGEARRVAIGRALLANPEFLLLDEPLSSLDHPRREEIMRAIERIRDHAGLPILMVTHDPSEAERLATQVIRMI